MGNSASTTLQSTPEQGSTDEGRQCGRNRLRGCSMMHLTESEVEKAIALCDAIVQSAAKIERMVAEAKKEIAVLARDLAKAMQENETQ